MIPNYAPSPQYKAAMDSAIGLFNEFLKTLTSDEQAVIAKAALDRHVVGLMHEYNVNPCGRITAKWDDVPLERVSSCPPRLVVDNTEFWSRP